MQFEIITANHFLFYEKSKILVKYFAATPQCVPPQYFCQFYSFLAMLICQYLTYYLNRFFVRNAFLLVYCQRVIFFN